MGPPKLGKSNIISNGYCNFVIALEPNCRKWCPNGTNCLEEMNVVKKIVWVWLAIGLAGIYLISCEDTVECGGFDTRFTVTGYTLNETSFDGNFFSSAEIAAKDTVPYDLVNLILSARYETVADLTPQKGQLFGSALACSPPILSPIDSIESIVIIENRNSEGITSQSVNYNANFEVVTFDEMNGYSEAESINSFNQTIHPAPIAIFLQYTQEPVETFPISFKIYVTLTNGESFELTSKMFYISP